MPDRKNNIGDDSEMENSGDAVKEYSDDAAATEGELLSYLLGCYTRAHGNMRAVREEWWRYYTMYSNDYRPPLEEGPFSDFCVTPMARFADLLRANQMSVMVPDPYRLTGLFRLAPHSVQPDKAMEQYAELCEAGIRSDLIDSNWVDDFDRSLIDLDITGNALGLVCWERKLKIDQEEIANPEYLKAIGPVEPGDEPDASFEVTGEGVFKIGADGVREPIEQTIMRYKQVREYDAPRVKYLNPMNVFPSELDRNNLEECAYVCIYDTTTAADLENDSIENGGKLYANLDKITFKDEREFVPEVQKKNTMQNSVVSESSLNNATKKLERVIQIGALDRKVIFGDRKITDEAWLEVCEKFNIDVEKAKVWTTWVSEIINEQTLVRLQPMPYASDEKGFVQAKLYSRPNQTWGHGIYKRGGEWEERAYNFFRRSQMTNAEMAAQPMIATIDEMFDQVWLQEQGDSIAYSPGKRIRLNQQASIDKAIQPMTWTATLLEPLRQQIKDHDTTMSMQNGVPAVRQGVASGGNTATEVTQMANNSQVLIDQICRRVETQYIKPMLVKMAALHKQYDKEPRKVRLFDDAGVLKEFEIPPDAWANGFAVQVLGSRTFGNKAVQAMNLNEFGKLAMTIQSDEFEFDAVEFAKEYARQVDIRDPDRFWKPKPPPPVPQPEIKRTLNIAVKAEDLPEPALSQVLALDGINVSPAALAVKRIHEQVDSGDGNGNANPRDHHTPNEIEQRQRGLHDAQGLQRTVAQTTRSPGAGRRFE